MTAYDELAQIQAADTCREWLYQVLRFKEDIIAFVSSRRPGCPKGEFAGYLKGSFNFGICVHFDDGEPDAIIRFPKPGHTFTDRREEKVRNEVRVLQYLTELTSLPVPHVTSWGLTDGSPAGLGPFIIMDRVEGVSLSTLLQQPVQSEQDDHVILSDDVDEAKLDYVYEQLAEVMLELSRFNFDSIGAITKNPDTNTWAAIERPFTYNMNEMATTVLNYPTDTFPDACFKTTKDFLEYQSDENLTHDRVQRNLAKDAEDAKRRYIARHRLRQLIPKYCPNNNGPFKLFCDDLQPSNILADPETFEIRVILDWEFTHAMPVQFSYDPPWWLILKGPDMWLEHFSMEEFLAKYEPRLRQFLRAMERAEQRLQSLVEEPKISSHMRESWESGRFWFDWGIRKSMDIDEVYWGALFREGDDVFDEEEQKKMEEAVETKMRNVRAYDEECKQKGI